MRRAYLLSYSQSLGTREEVKSYLDKMPEVITWRSDLPNSFYLISEEDSETIAKSIRDLAGQKGRFLISELKGNVYGWLTPDSWYLINNKRRKPK